MKLYSTSDRGHQVTFAEAVDRGLAPDGGLYLPTEYPSLPEGVLTQSVTRPFAETAWEISRRLLGDEIPESALEAITANAFSFPVPVIRLDERLSVLELFHGPTLAFKDVGARFMARVMAYFHRNDDREIVILVATSGDTGGAVASGFDGVPGVRVVLLYPGGRVSHLQELQLTTGGDNVTTLRVEGSFDDCQRLVKQAFQDQELLRGRTITSANSINIARLLPQSFYYVTAWGKLHKEAGGILLVIPSGNFGNVTAALMARAMGMAASGMIAATNVNDVFSEYLRTGSYRPRAAIKTLSNAMDVGDPSNIARIRAIFQDDLVAMRRVISTCATTDEETLLSAREAFDRFGYVFDPHGAVGYMAARRYIDGGLGEAHALVLATAHPAKFPEALDPERREAAGTPLAIGDLQGRTQRQTPVGDSYEELRSILSAM